MNSENVRLLAESTILPLTAWVGMTMIDGAFYAIFQAGKERYALMCGPPKVFEGIEMATRAVIGGGVVPMGKRAAPKHS